MKVLYIQLNYENLTVLSKSNKSALIALITSHFKSYEKASILFPIFLLHSIFNIEKKCVLTVLKAVDRKTIKTECLVSQDMRECRAYQQIAFMKRAHVSSIVIEANHNVLFVYQAVVSRHNKLLKIDFPLTLMVYHRTISAFIKKTKCEGLWGIYQRLDLAKE